ncbi:hypothetical protein [Geodermatophilus sp. URMC 63]
MTLLVSRPSRPVPAPAPARAPAGAPARPVVPPALGWLVAAAEVLVVAASYRVAADGGSPRLYYGVFWMGTLVMVAPFAAVLLSAGASARARTAAVVSFGLVTYVPKFLRNPYGPAYHDEPPHFRAVEDLLRSRELYRQNPLIQIIGDFPGLHVVTATLEGLTGLSVWGAATVVLLTAHVAAVVAVLALGRLLLPDPRAAGLAAVVYGLNPSYVYFDTQFSYESLAVCLFLWVLTLTVAAAATTGSARALRLAGAVVLTLACVPTHHLTTLVLIVVTAVVLATHTLFRRLDPTARGRWRPWALVLVTATAGFTLWMLTVADTTWSYLAPYAEKAVGSLSQHATGQESQRTLFAGSVQPLYERLLGMAAPLLLVAVFLAVLWRTRLLAGWAHRRMALGLTAVGGLYFASLPLLFTPEGYEGTRRSWAFTYVGVAVVVAAALALLLWRSARRRWATAAVAVLLAAVLVGNTGAGPNDAYRFPGPYELGSAPRSITPELLALSEEFGRRHPGARTVSDRYTNQALVGFGGAVSAQAGPGFRVWDLFFEAGTPDPYLVHELDTSDFAYVVVDERLSRYVPAEGTYFSREGEPTVRGDEPYDPAARQSQVPQEALDRFETAPWATKVLATTNYSVYRLDFASVGTPQCDRPGCEVAGP